LARFCTQANNSGNRDGPEAQAIVRACFSDVRVAPAASTFSRDFETGARADMSNAVSAFSRDEAYGAQVFIDSSRPDDKSQMNGCKDVTTPIHILALFM